MQFERFSHEIESMFRFVKSFALWEIIWDRTERERESFLGINFKVYLTSDFREAFWVVMMETPGCFSLFRKLRIINWILNMQQQNIFWDSLVWNFLIFYWNFEYLILWVFFGSVQKIHCTFKRRGISDLLQFVLKDKLLYGFLSRCQKSRKFHIICILHNLFIHL